MINIHFCSISCKWTPHSVSLTRSPAIAPGQLGQVGIRIMSPSWMLLELRMVKLAMKSAAIWRGKLQSNGHHQQTDTQLFYRQLMYSKLEIVTFVCIYPFESSSLLIQTMFEFIQLNAIESTMYAVPN